jgi:hypothetical protein
MNHGGHTEPEHSDGAGEAVAVPVGGGLRRVQRGGLDGDAIRHGHGRLLEVVRRAGGSAVTPSSEPVASRMG